MVQLLGAGQPRNFSSNDLLDTTMGYIINLVHRINRVGSILGGAFLIGLMLIIVMGIVIRIIGGSLILAYEAPMLMIIVAVGFAIVIAAQEKTHVSVEVVVSQFSERIHAIINIFTYMIF